MEKEKLRELFKNQLSAISIEDREEASAVLLSEVLSYLGPRQETWSLFAPLADEPNLLKLLQSSLGIRWVFPKIQSPGNLGFYHVERAEQLATNAWGLMQPRPEVCPAVSLSDIDGFIIPALAYDEGGVRLGRGGGFYDQTLKNFKGLRVGVAFDQGYSESPLPKDHHDQLVDIVVTPTKFIQVRGI